MNISQLYIILNISLFLWQVSQVRDIIMNDFYSVLYVTALDNEVLEIIIIHNSCTQPPAGSGVRKQCQSIYPSLDNSPV